LLLLFSFVLLLGIEASVFSKTIAVIPVKGEIASGASGLSEWFSAEELAEQIKKADEDDRIGAIVLDIDSPGGTIVATKQVVYQVRKTSKPVVSYIGEVGASGGYYVAAASNYIIADEDSITASIGVISMYPDINGLLDKLGIKMNILTEGKNKAIGNPFSEPTEEQRQILQSLLSEAFSHFKRDILDYRKNKLDPVRFEEIADGRIMSGTQAKDAGLIDELGTRQDAIDKAAELAGIQGTPLVEYIRRPQLTLIDLFANAGYSFGSGFQQSLIANGGSKTPTVSVSH